MKKNILTSILIILSLTLTSCIAIPNRSTDNGTAKATEDTGTRTETYGTDPLETNKEPDETTVTTDSGDIPEESDSFEPEPQMTEDTSSEKNYTSSEEATTEPAETYTPQLVIPDESYVGRWCRYPSSYYDQIEIYSVSPGSVYFHLATPRGSLGTDIKATAFENNGRYYFGKDISPDFEYNLYSLDDTVDLSGYLTFDEFGVTLTFNKMVFFATELKFKLKDTSYEKYESLSETQRGIIKDLGWNNGFKVCNYDYGHSAGEFNDVEAGWDIKRYPDKSKLVVTYLGGSENLIVGIRYVLDRAADSWIYYDTFYVKSDASVTLQGEELESLLKENGKTEALLSPSDPVLTEYFK